MLYHIKFYFVNPKQIVLLAISYYFYVIMLEPV